MTNHRSSYQGYVKLFDGDFRTNINIAVDKAELNQIGNFFMKLPNFQTQLEQYMVNI